MSALRSLSEGKQTLPNVDYKRPCTMTTPSGTGVLLKGKTLSPLQRSKCDKCGFRGRKFYLCALLPNSVRWRDAHGATCRFPQVDGEYVARMEDVLDLYAEAPDPKRPVVCFDESPTQLIGEVRLPIPAEPGQLKRYDCEYKRNGTANLFIFLDVPK
jgi:hypothetical protein